MNTMFMTLYTLLPIVFGACVDRQIIFVLGGPGVGKGTQCGHLSKRMGFEHICPGDLLRKEQEDGGSPYADVIKRCLKQAVLVPVEFTIELIKKEILKVPLDRWILVDGFPRSMDLAIELTNNWETDPSASL